MAKVKRVTPVFDPSIYRFAFGNPAPVAEESANATAASEDEVTEENHKPAVVRRAGPPNLRHHFATLFAREFERTKFARRRIEFYLPPTLRQIFKMVDSTGGRIAVDEAGQKLLEYVEKNIYGVLPDYESFAMVEQTSGFFIDGKPVEISMSRRAALRQMQDITSKVDKGELIRTAEVRLREKFSLKAITDVVYSSGNVAVNRQLAAHIVQIANDLK